MEDTKTPKKPKAQAQINENEKVIDQFVNYIHRTEGNDRVFENYLSTLFRIDNDSIISYYANRYEK